MNLVIRANTLNDQPLTQAIDGCFDARGGTIGRSEGNTMALPDPERHISRLQAEVSFEGGRFLIRNAGSANPILVNGHSLGPGDRAALAHRDELRIGGYVLGVTLAGADDDVRTMARPPVDARRAAAAPAATVPAPLATANPFADLMGAEPPAASAGAVDPFAFLSSGDGFAAGSAPPVAARAPSPPPPPSAAPASPRLPEDFDPFADITADSTPPPSPAAMHSAAGEKDLLGSVGASSGAAVTVDSLFGLDAVPQGSSDPLAAFMHSAPPREDKAAARASAFDHTAELAGAYTPPRILDPAPEPQAAPLRAVPAPPPPSRRSADADALWAAFCEGAGVKLPPAQAADAAQMRVLGQVMREAIEGTVRLMGVRATAKQELRAAVTTIRGRNNNPLKFAPDAQLATEQLMQPPLRGFMSAPAAMQDAMHDLVGHSIGTMAGMRAALAGVLERFQPQQLEAKLSEKSMLDSLLAMNRKAKLWDMYLQHFEAIRNEAQDDFQTLFGKAFVAAYEEQLDRLPQRSDAA